VAHYCGIGMGVMKDIALRSGGSQAHMLRMNAEEMLLPAGYFDRIISLSTFEHFFHPDLVLEEMHRVLQPGGAALVSFQPIWTCARGHHLHHIPEVGRLIPPWAHLRWTPDQMRTALGPTWPAGAQMTLDDTIEWIYASEEINRIDLTGLRAFFRDSPLRIEWMTPLEDEQLKDEDRLIAEELSQILPYSAEDLRIKGFSALLIRD
jgi:SAM-dependent methyltransferase